MWGPGWEVSHGRSLEGGIRAYPGLVEAEEGKVFAVGREPKNLSITVNFCSLSIPIHSFIH